MLPLPLALLILSLTYWTVDTIGPALPGISSSLGMNATGTGLIVAFFFGGRLIANFPAAWLVERGGPRLTAMVGALILGIGSGVAAIAADQTVLLVGRALQGVGVAMLATAGLLSLLRALPAGGRAMTAFNVASGVGGFCGLLAGGVLAAGYGWQTIFVSSTGLALIIFIASAANHPALSRRGRGAVAAETGVQNTRSPAIPSRISIGAALVLNLLVYANYSIWAVSIPLFSSDRFEMGPDQVALLLIVVNCLHMAAAFPVGGVIRRYGSLAVLTVGFAVSGSGMVLATTAPDQAWFYAPMALYAIGQVAGNSGAGDLLLRLGGGGGRAVGMVRLTSDIGLVAGPAFAGVATDAAGVQAPFVALGAASGLAAVVLAAVLVTRRSMDVGGQV